MTRMISVFVFAVLAAPVLALAQNGYVGIYADPSGSTACTNVPPGSGTVLYVLATVEGPTASGITGAEFRIEISNPAGWFFSYNAPTGARVERVIVGLRPADPEPTHLAGAERSPAEAAGHEACEALAAQAAIDHELRHLEVEEEPLFEHRVVADAIDELPHPRVDETPQVENSRS